MADLGIVFGCFDLIVTPDGEVVFLEVNQTGSFLWIEEQNPEFRLLDAFSEFLIRATPGFTGSEAASCIKFGDVRAEALERMQNQGPPLHVAKSQETLKDQLESIDELR